MAAIPPGVGLDTPHSVIMSTSIIIASAPSSHASTPFFDKAKPAAWINSSWRRYSIQTAATIAAPKGDSVAFYQNSMATDVLANFTKGLIFGAALAAAGVASPSIITGQLALRESHMLKVFLTASASSA
jgi:hypothetical protein